ncbi:hypothetical protein Tco_0107594, partial [Tanacetum coccineum]
GGDACGMDVMINSTWQALSSTPPQSSSSSSSCWSSQHGNALKKKNAILLQTLEVTKSTNDALFDIVKDLARFDLEDE